MFKMVNAIPLRMIFHKTSNTYPNLNAIPLNATISNEQQFKLNKVNKIKNYFLTEIRERELISKNINKYVASLDYFDKLLNVLSILAGSISTESFATVIRTPTGVMGASCGLTFSITSGFKKKKKTIRNKKKKHNKTIVLARSKLNSIESKISKALIDNEINHEDFMTILNEEKKYRELKESIRMMNSQRSDAEKVYFIKKGKKIGLNEVIKRNEIINNSLK